MQLTQEQREKMLVGCALHPCEFQKSLEDDMGLCLLTWCSGQNPKGFGECLKLRLGIEVD